ncbi:hypothetical protein ACWEPC_37985, partial [Nonomuraea sp. NPDC004297]
TASGEPLRGPPAVPFSTIKPGRGAHVTSATGGSPGRPAAGVLAATAGLVLVGVRRRPRRDGGE